MSKIFVFLGPSLSIERAREILPQAYYLPPLRCGDVLKVMRLQPDVIVIIDGFFERTATVWHKEILFALSRGVRVYGAASMGALRAAELHTFGMQGVGKIFQAYAEGVLQDDDEVAVLHEDAAHGYTPITDAMVNIRSTMEYARDQGVLDAEVGEAVVQHAKALHYARRDLQTIYKQITGIPYADVAYVNQKALDAEAVLKEAGLDSRLPKSDWRLPHTSCLHTLQRMISGEPFVINAEWLPIQEKVGWHAAQLPQYYPMLKRLARMMAIVHALALTRYQVSEDSPVFGHGDYDVAWAESNDCPNREAFVRRLQYLAAATGFQAVDEVPKDVERYMRCFHCLMAPEPIELDAQQERLLLYTAYLWRAVAGAILQAGLTLGGLELDRYIIEFCMLRGLVDPDALQAWLQQYQMDAMDLREMVRMTVYFDVIVKSNNVELMDAFSRECDTWWLLDALYLTGLYGEVKRISCNE